MSERPTALVTRWRLQDDGSEANVAAIMGRTGRRRVVRRYWAPHAPDLAGASRNCAMSLVPRIDSLEDISVKASNVPKPTMLERLKSWIEWFAKLEELFVGDPHESIRRMSALELEIRALKAHTPERHRKGAPPDDLI